jgi:hypothetical protein
MAQSSDCPLQSVGSIISAPNPFVKGDTFYETVWTVVSQMLVEAQCCSLHSYCSVAYEKMSTFPMLTPDFLLPSTHHSLPKSLTIRNAPRARLLLNVISAFFTSR